MALFRCSFRSKVLQMDTIANVVIPYDHYDLQGNPGQYDKVLYLLHGLKQNADAWQRLSSAERYANYYGYCLVMPEVQRSFYTDMEMGMPYFTYITEELPEMMHQMFRLPNRPDHTFVGGLSMGGYGALKCVLNHPEKYAGAICLSSGFFTLNRAEFLIQNYYPKGELQAILGPELQAAEDDDMEKVMQRHAVQQHKPYLYLACGTEDPLYPRTVEMRNLLRKNGLDVTYEEWPGIHDWRFWDVGLEKGMIFMNEQLKKRG